jgi:hypothetical protein
LQVFPQGCALLGPFAIEAPIALARRRFDVAAKVIKAMFDASKRGTRSNWQGAIRIRWYARLDSLTAPRHFTSRPIRVSARHANAF